VHNELIFEGKMQCPRGVQRNVSMNMQALWEVNYRGMRHNEAERQHPKYFTWLMPKMGELKLNFDGNGVVGCGFLICDVRERVWCVGYSICIL